MSHRRLRHVTGQINDLVHFAGGETGHLTNPFTKPFKALVQVTPRSLTTGKDSLPCLGLGVFASRTFSFISCVLRLLPPAPVLGPAGLKLKLLPPQKTFTHPSQLLILQVSAETAVSSEKPSLSFPTMVVSLFNNWDLCSPILNIYLQTIKFLWKGTISVLFTIISSLSNKRPTLSSSQTYLLNG